MSQGVCNVNKTMLPQQAAVDQFSQKQMKNPSQGDIKLKKNPSSENQANANEFLNTMMEFKCKC